MPRPAKRKAAPTALPKITAHNVDALHDLDQCALRALWIEHFGRPPPGRARTSLLVDCLAYRIQEQALGGLALSTRTRLRKLAHDVIDGKKPALLFQSTIKPGTRLIRAWSGHTHEVQVIDDGFTYRDTRYSNLSEIARVITGSRWSGPRFFGILKITDKPTEGRHGQ